MSNKLPTFRVWVITACVAYLVQTVLFLFTPAIPTIATAAETDFARIWPYIDRLEYEGDNAQQGRALRWAPMRGVLRIPDMPTSGMSITTVQVHTARPPSAEPLRARFDTSTNPTTFLLAPGWRRIALLTSPQQAWRPYDEITYELQGLLLSTRRDLGVAVAYVQIAPTSDHTVDWQREVFVLLSWLWIVLIGIARRWSPWVVASVIACMLTIWGFAAIPLTYYVPNHWSVIGYIWMMTAVVVLAPLRRPRLPFLIVLLSLVSVLGLWQLGFGWGGSITLLMVWFFAKPWPVVSWPDRHEITSMRWMWGILLLVVTCAGLLRLWGLDAYPTGLFRDEARHGGLALRILAGERMVYSPVANLPAGYFYLSALPIWWFGASAWSIRIIAALVGTGSVLIIGWMLNAWWGMRVAIWSCVALATLLWHIGLSRIGFPATLGPMLTMIAIGAWARIMQSPRAFAWAVCAGVATGLMLMVYHSARLMPLVVVLSIVIMMLYFRMPIRRIALAGVVFAVVALVVASPMLWYAITQPDNYMRRIGVTSIMSDAAIRGLPIWLALFDNIQAYVGMLFVHGDENPRHFNLGAPQLNLIEAVGFIVGLIWLRQSQPIWLWWLCGWLGIGLLSGVLSVDAPHALRTVEAIIPVVILVGIGWYRIATIVPSRWHVWLIVGVLCGSALWAAPSYHDWQSNMRTQSRFDTDATNDVRFIQQLLTHPRPADAFVYIPERMRRSDLGIYLLHQSGVRTIGDNVPEFDRTQQHLVLLPITQLPPSNAEPISALPIGMGERYSLWCFGQCNRLDWVK